MTTDDHVLARELAAEAGVRQSEEGADDPARLTASRVWIADPLDGTREFGEPGRTDWAVHQAGLMMPDILVCLPALAGALLQAIGEVTDAC